MSNAPLTGANLRGAVDLSSLVRPAQSNQASSTTGGVVRAATDASFSEVMQLSSTVPVVVEFYGQNIQSTLGPMVEQYGGRLALATVDGAANPQLVQAFNVELVPTVAAVIAGRPVQLFTGTIPDNELREVFDQLLQLAAQNGVSGSIPVGDAEEPAGAEEPLPPHHQEAFDAISAGDYATAIKEYETAIARNPRDLLAVAGLAQVSLLARIDGADAGAALARAGEAPNDLNAQLAAADFDVASGRAVSAFDRVLELFPSLDASGKDRARTRLLEYFEIVGLDDPTVIAARRRLTLLLF
ncbi:MAG: tetratricopeptide repeat protein [Salinibacterium sp.]|nr:MAG: tetratricopeptide repeat protein [Salinibacterium sp.]